MKRPQVLKTELANAAGRIGGTCKYLFCGKMEDLSLITCDTSLVMVGCDACCELKIKQMRTEWPQFICEHKNITIRNTPLSMRGHPDNILREEYCPDCCRSETIIEPASNAHAGRITN